MSAPPTVSVVLITRDEARRIERCLRSVDFAHEVVVVDSGSTDETVAIARAAGARVTVLDDWPGFGIQKNRALDLATGDWVLSIDADEVVTPRLRDAILAAIRHPAGAEAFWLQRRSCFAGKPLRFGDWHGDRVLRLFRRGAARFTEDLVHERLAYDGAAPVLDGLLMHYTIDSLEDALEKGRRYAEAGAPRVAARGRGGLGSAVGHATWTFLRGYLLRGGFLDGREGLLLAWCNAAGTWQRYRIAGRLRRRARARN
jgi:glycosyltransferase involved in cell wall biosynthesis